MVFWLFGCRLLRDGSIVFEWVWDAKIVFRPLAGGVRVPILISLAPVSKWLSIEPRGKVAAMEGKPRNLGCKATQGWSCHRVREGIYLPSGM